MDNASLNAPRAKRWVNQEKNSPFPVPLATLIGHSPSVDEWIMYKGCLHGNSVLVRDPNHMEALFKMGFYGKATFSRSGPSSERQSKDSPAIMSRRRYKAHQAWKDLEKDSGSSSKAYSSNEILVIGDSDSETEPMADSHAMKYETKEDPFPLKQNLHLMLEEAFFLSYGLGCLLVRGDDEKDMNLEEMWACFYKLDKLFVYKYVAYHHFRSKGWVVRPGIKFGANYTLYKDGPPFYHASYSVLVKPVAKDSFDTLPDVVEYPNTWSSLAGLNRVTAHVNKELLYCYVMWTTDLPLDEMMSPDCISKFQVQEMLIRRWVSSEEREAEENA